MNEGAATVLLSDRSFCNHSHTPARADGSTGLAQNVYDPFNYAECCAAELEEAGQGSAIACQRELDDCLVMDDWCSEWLTSCVGRYLRCVEQAAFGERVSAMRCGWAQEMAGLVTFADRREADGGQPRLEAECRAAVEWMLGSRGCGPGEGMDGAVAAACRQSDVPAAVGGVQPDATPAASAPRPAGMNALVVRGDQCETCERAYYDGSCGCPAETRAVELRGYHGDMVYGQRGAGCYGGGFSFLFCMTWEVATNMSDPRQVNFFSGTPAADDSSTRMDGSVEDGAVQNTVREVKLGRCIVPHGTTGDCSCPAEMIPRPMLLPQPTGNALGLEARAVVFCAPVETTVHILNAETGACYNPLGANISCDCAVGSPSVVVPIAYVNVTTREVSPGLLRFCSAAPEDTRMISEAVLGMGAAVASVGGAGAAGGIQGASAIEMIYCGDDGLKPSKEPDVILVPFRLGGNAVTGGVLALLTCVAGVFVLHAVVCAIFYLVRRLRKGEASVGYAVSVCGLPGWSCVFALLAVQGAVIESARTIVKGESQAHYVIGGVGALSLIGFLFFTQINAFPQTTRSTRR